MKNGLKCPKNRAENFPVRKKFFPSWKNNIFQLENFFRLTGENLAVLKNLYNLEKRKVIMRVEDYLLTLSNGQSICKQKVNIVRLSCF